MSSVTLYRASSLALLLGFLLVAGKRVPLRFPWRSWPAMP